MKIFLPEPGTTLRVLEDSWITVIQPTFYTPLEESETFVKKIGTRKALYEEYKEDIYEVFFKRGDLISFKSTHIKSGRRGDNYLIFNVENSSNPKLKKGLKILIFIEYLDKLDVEIVNQLSLSSFSKLDILKTPLFFDSYKIDSYSISARVIKLKLGSLELPENSWIECSFLFSFSNKRQAFSDQNVFNSFSSFKYLDKSLKMFLKENIDGVKKQKSIRLSENNLNSFLTSFIPQEEIKQIIFSKFAKKD